MRNKIMILAAVVFLTAIYGAAQTPASVEFSDPKIVWDADRKFNIQYPNSPSSSRAPFTTEVVQEISALFRNTGSRTITKISWEFITRKADSPTKIEYVYTVSSKTNIAPGETVRLSKTGIFWGRSVSLEARAVRVEYADGTVWQGTKTKN